MKGRKNMLKNAVTLLVACYALTGCVNSSDKPVLIDRKKASDTNVSLATMYLQEGNLGAANGKILKALKQNPRSVQANSTYASLLAHLGQNAKSEKYFKKAISLDSEDSGVRNNYGVFLCDQGRINEGLVQFGKAVLDPLYSTPEYAYANAGACCLRYSRFDKAESYLRKALLKNRRMPLALYQMAKLNYLQKRLVLAKNYLDRFHLITPKSAESAWLGMRLALHMRDRVSVTNYSLLLRNKFPDSVETQKLTQMMATKSRRR